MFARVVVGLTCILFSAFAEAQNAQEYDAGQVVLRSTTRLVQVNVVAHDKSGRPVTDLKQEEFVVKDMGKVQQIRTFSVESKDKPFGATPKLPPNVFSNRLGERGAPTSVTVILIDAVNMRWADQKYAASAVIDFLRQVQPEDKIGLYLLAGTGMRIVHEFTEDAGTLLRALASLQSVTSFQASPEQLATPAERALLELVAKERGYETTEYSPSHEQISQQPQAPYIFLMAQEAIANHLAGIPGRKNVLWVTNSLPVRKSAAFSDRPPLPGKPEGWYPGDYTPPRPGMVVPSGDFSRASSRPRVISPQNWERIVRLLNDANLAVYPVDASGLTVNGGGSGRRDGMKELARMTGGRAFVGRNDVMNSIREAIKDSHTTYEIGYYPKELARDGRFHPIDVEVKRPGVKLRYRSGYVDFPELPRDQANIQKSLREACWTPLDATGVWLDTRLDMVKEEGRELLAVHTVVSPSSVSLEKGSDGQWHGHLEYIFMQTDDKGRECATSGRTIKLKLSEESYRNVMKDSFVHQTFLPREAAAQRLRVVVSDVPSGKTGSVTIPFRKVVEDLRISKD